MSVPTAILTVFTMTGRLLTPPYQSIYWDVYNTPDFAGTFSGYVGQLQNIKIAATQNINSPVNNVVTPTSPATGDLTGNYPNPTVVGIDGYPINQSIIPTAGQVLTYNSSDGYVEWANITNPTLTFITAIAAPASPAAGFVLYIDIADGKLKAKAHTGTVSILASP